MFIITPNRTEKLPLHLSTCIMQRNSLKSLYLFLCANENDTIYIYKKNYTDKNFQFSLLTVLRQGGGGGGDRKEVRATSFSTVTSINVETSPQNCLTFSFNPCATRVLNSKFIPNVSPKLLNLNEDQPSKTVFLVKSL